MSFFHVVYIKHYRPVVSGGARPGRARSNDLAGKSTALAPPCLLLCFGNSMNRKYKCYHDIWQLYLFYFEGETISGVGGLCFKGD